MPLVRRFLLASLAAGVLLASGCTGADDLEGLTILLLPALPTLDDDLVVEIDSHPRAFGDTDFRLQYLWFQNEQLQGDISGSTVTSDLTAASDTWRVEVTPILGVTQGTAAVAEVRLPSGPPDDDGDGYEGPGGDGSDCDDTNPLIHPGATEVCNEVDDDCNGLIDDGLRDADDDGVGLCEDCDDEDPTRFPGAEEVCNGLDDDCDLLTDEEQPDVDGDGFDRCEDCDDDDNNVHAGAPELCNGSNDDNCDGIIDPDEVDLDGDGISPCDGDCNDLDDTAHTYDLDGDGYSTCAVEPDCDEDPILGFDRNPGNEEICNGIDDDCSGVADDNLPDADIDGFTACDGDCDDDDFLTYPGAAEICDEEDNDCDGLVPEVELDLDGDGARAAPCGNDCDDSSAALNILDLDQDGATTCDALADCDDNDPLRNVADLDGDGQSTCGADGLPGSGDEDCDDSDTSIYAGAPELCDGADNDCNGVVDNGLIFTNWYLDGDNDGIGASATEQPSCSGAPDINYVSVGGDCDDNNASRFPGNIETCDTIDNDCDALIDEDFDLDGDSFYNASACGFGNDCDDLNASIYTGAAEVCNLQDDNCNGTIDEGFDSDGDLYFDSARCSFGLDCDDNNGNRYPGNLEICDGADNDCDNLFDEGFDVDGDGVTTCGPDGAFQTPDDDCDDTSPTIYGGAVELCDLLDNNCDGGIDEDVVFVFYYPDLDGDGDGDLNQGQSSCLGPLGPPMVELGTDCDDSDANNFSANSEVCDGADNNCDSLIDNGLPFESWYQDLDGDGFGNDGVSQNTCDGPPAAGYVTVGGDCDDSNGTNFPGNSEFCDGSDNDCDSLVDDDLVFTAWYLDADGDGVGSQSAPATTCSGPPAANWIDSSGDCDDADPLNFPLNPEICDLQDNDCDSVVDEDLTFTAWYLDSDGDGFGNSATVQNTCGGAPASNYITVGGDCDDAAAGNFPGNPEACDGLDNDCDGSEDNGLSFQTWYDDGDGDGFGDDATSQSTCDGAPGSGYITTGGDCDDTLATGTNNFPGNPEVCDGVDNDCDINTPENIDLDNDGFDICEGDCDDGDANLSPGEDEGTAFGNTTDGIDNDCDGGADEYSFDEIWTQVLSVSCGCHTFGGGSGGQSLGSSAASAYSAWVNVATTSSLSPSPSINRIHAGNSSLSYVMHKLDGTQASVGGGGSQMPNGCSGSSCLDQTTRDRIRAWIDSGAPQTD